VGLSGGGGVSVWVSCFVGVRRRFVRGRAVVKSTARSRGRVAAGESEGPCMGVLSMGGKAPARAPPESCALRLRVRTERVWVFAGLFCNLVACCARGMGMCGVWLVACARTSWPRLVHVYTCIYSCSMVMVLAHILILLYIYILFYYYIYICICIHISFFGRPVFFFSFSF